MVVWDDWCRYDHVAPTILPGNQPHYQLGFRVPFLMSAYTPKATVSNLRHEFGSIIRFMEGVFDFPEGALGFSDAHYTMIWGNFFNFKMTHRRPPFQTIVEFDPKQFVDSPWKLSHRHY